MHELSTQAPAPQMTETGMMDLEHNVEILSRSKITTKAMQFATTVNDSDTPIRSLASFIEAPEAGQDPSKSYDSVIHEGGLIVSNTPGDTSACEVFIIKHFPHGSSLKYAYSSDSEIAPPPEIDKNAYINIPKGTRVTTFIARGVIPTAEDRVAAARGQVFTEARGEDSAEVKALYQRIVKTIPYAAEVLQAKEITISSNKLVGWLEHLGMRTRLGMRKRLK